MKNKIISLLLTAALVFSVCVVFAGCDDNKDYPVQVANLTIDKEPENIVVLSAETADIISYIGYDVKMAGRSDEVDQDFLSIVPSVGSAASPNVEQIKASGATVVFADDTLDSGVKQSLQSENITVVTLAPPTTTKELETAYVTVGKILGGEVTGSNKGAEQYQDLLSSMNDIKNSVNSGDIPRTVCYLYLENDALCMCPSGSYGDMLLGYTGAVNVAVNIEVSTVENDTLKVANPTYIFYADEATLEYIKKNPDLSGLTAVKSNKTLMVTAGEISRMGTTALDTLRKMVEFMYPELVSSGGDSTASTEATQSETQASQSVADDYKIKLDSLSLNFGDDNDSVKAMQQRLYDLGYVDDKENITGYYGELTEASVKEFQKANGLEESGTADNETLVALFMSDAKKAE